MLAVVVSVALSGDIITPVANRRGTPPLAAAHKNKVEMPAMQRRRTGLNVIAILVATVCWYAAVPGLCAGDGADGAFAPAVGRKENGAAEPSGDAATGHDVVIYGGTSSAVVAAVRAKHAGASVIVVSPDMHLGGLSSGGLGYTDSGNTRAIGSLAREFYRRVWKHYQSSAA